MRQHARLQAIGDLGSMPQGPDRSIGEPGNRFRGVIVLVDSPVWIAVPGAAHTAQTERLRAIVPPGRIVVGDLILLEILQPGRAAALARALR